MDAVKIYLRNRKYDQKNVSHCEALGILHLGQSIPRIDQIKFVEDSL